MSSMQEAADKRIKESAKERTELVHNKNVLEDLVKDIERQARKEAKPSVEVSDIELTTSRIRARDSGHIKFLEMLCILENSIAELEG